MIIYPAIDMLGGKCVRLTQGDYEKSRVFGENPAEMAQKWQQGGAEYIHLVDLDGAKAGEPVNIQAITAVRESVSARLQLGGGIRTESHIKHILDIGIDRIILGTSAAKEPYFLYRMIEKFGERIIVGLDAKDGMVATSGWEKTEELCVFEYAKFVKKLGAKTIIFTDIATDGMMQGPNRVAMERMAKTVDIDVIASGGVSCAEDITVLKSTGVSGVIIGKALYMGSVTIEEAISCG